MLLQADVNPRPVLLQELSSPGGSDTEPHVSSEAMLDQEEEPGTKDSLLLPILSSQFLSPPNVFILKNKNTKQLNNNKTECLSKLQALYLAFRLLHNINPSSLLPGFCEADITSLLWTVSLPLSSLSFFSLASYLSSLRWGRWCASPPLHTGSLAPVEFRLLHWPFPLASVWGDTRHWGPLSRLCCHQD